MNTTQEIIAVPQGQGQEEQLNTYILNMLPKQK